MSYKMLHDFFNILDLECQNFNTSIYDVSVMDHENNNYNLMSNTETYPSFDNVKSIIIIVRRSFPSLNLIYVIKRKEEKWIVVVNNVNSQSFNLNDAIIYLRNNLLENLL